MTRYPSRPMGPVRNIVRKPHDVTEWARNRPCCYWCGTNYHVHSHHIEGKSGRSDEPCNLVRACERCHSRIHGITTDGKQPISKLEVLLKKREKDPHEWDLLRLEEIRGGPYLLSELL